MPSIIEGERLYTLAEAAEALGVHYNTIKNWIYSGTLRANKVGRSYRVTGTELKRVAGIEAVTP
jgi:excisionase family DNA binding protein